jgi:S-adenosylmethionine synthetase
LPIDGKVQAFGTGRIPNERITKLLQKHFDFRLAGILKQFDLRPLPAESSLGFFEQFTNTSCHIRPVLDLGNPDPETSGGLV